MVVDNEFTSDPRVYNEAKILVNANYDVQVLCFNFSVLPINEERDGIKIHRLTISKKLKDYLFSSVNTIALYDCYWAYQINKATKSFNPDFIHVHDLYMARAANWANIRKKIKLILDLHENYPAAVMSYNWAIKYPKRLLARPSKWRKKERRFLNFADRIIVLSEEYRNSLIHKYPEIKKENFVIYPNVPDLKELFSYKIDYNIFNTEGKTLFYFGGIAERRGIFTCIEALKILIDEGINVKLLLIGPVDRADQIRFTKVINEITVRNHIIHYPWKDISTLPSYLFKSFACLSPIIKNEQHESGVANKVFQYMLFKRPVIVSNCTPQVSIIEKYACGLVFRSEDANDLALKIKFLIDHPKEVMKMGENGQEAVLNKYNLENYKINLLNLYESLAE